MIRVLLSGKEDSKEHIVSILIDKTKSIFTIDGLMISYETSELFEDLIDYEFHRSSDVEYVNRKFFNHFSSFKSNMCIVNMLRAFACSNAYLNLHLTDSKSYQPLCDVIKTANEEFSDKLLIDWTEREEPQPQMYFIDKQLISKENDLLKLYDLQLLQKYAINWRDKSFSSYFVPFIIPSVKYYALLPAYSTWRTISSGINNEVKRIVNNWRHA